MTTVSAWASPGGITGGVTGSMTWFATLGEHSRRRVLIGCGSLALAGARQSAARAGEPTAMLVAGAQGGRLDRWVAILVPALQRALPARGVLSVQHAGGDDGVTGANQFDTREPGEGTALLLPGAAAADWLAGDPRVHFDVARWLPVLCGVSGGVLAARRSLAQARPANPLRLALPDPLSAASACLLGLDLLHVPVLPVHVADPAAALRASEVDAAFMPGPLAGAAMAEARALPLFILGAAGLAPLDPALHGVPALGDLLAGASGTDPMLVSAWRAMQAASQLRFALVLPALTRASSVALWREAADQAASDAPLRDGAEAGVRSLAATGSATILGSIAIGGAALLAYRHWLAERLGYQPG